MADQSVTQPRPSNALAAWRIFIIAALIVFAIAAGIGVWFTYRVFNPPLSRAVTEQFMEYAPTAGPTDGILETATSSVPETFTHTDSAWLFKVIPLGTTVSEIRVPAVYRYHIQLFDQWKLVTRGQVCIVVAPQFSPDLPPAILTDQMEKSTSNGWLRFNGEDDLAELERDITEELDRRADDKTHRNFVREACRHAVAQFVRNWMMKEDYWRQDRFHQIVVLFPDEVPANDGNLTYYQPHPTITFEDQSSSSAH